MLEKKKLDLDDDSCSILVGSPLCAPGVVNAFKGSDYGPGGLGLKFRRTFTGDKGVFNQLYQYPVP